MIARLLYAIVVGLVGAALVHILVIFAMPHLAENNAWGRFARLGPLNETVRVEALRSAGPDTIAGTPGSDRHDFAFVDPAFVNASCRFSLADGPVRMIASYGPTTFWSASIYDRNGDNLYSINDRSAVDGIFDLLVGTHDQIVDANAVVETGDDTTIPVEVDLTEGYMTIRVLVDEESKRPSVEDFVASLACRPLGPISANQQPETRRDG
ncbi:hypothetical protein VQ042_10435 [Aurantimonas sp. A2-1-M11]|uniref:DUF1254 domain-containing protein n=1 Tax=Aurantimonas sp. A2-1-M11 TaxID=3113712 RepID=UPI002F942B75